MKKLAIPWLVLGLVAVWALPAMAEDIQPFKPQVLYPEKFDISKPLRDVKVGKPVEMGKPREIVNRVIPKVLNGGSGKYDKVQNFPGRLSTPSPLLTFQGLDSDDNQAAFGFRVMPPDTEGDVGPNHYFEWINLVFKIYDKNGNTVLGPLPGNAFWSGFGGPCETDNDGDPIVLYDHLADRWFVEQFSATSPYRLCFALSVTSDPTGSYYRWQYVFGTSGNSKFPDYPKVGVWHDAYYVGFNQFLNLSSWSGAGALGLEKAKMLIGDPNPAMIYFDLYSVNPNFGNMFPAHLEGPVTGTPDGIFMEWDDSTWLGDPQDALRIWYFHPDWVTPANSTFGVSGQPNEIVYTANIDPDMCGYSRNCIPQQGTSQKLDALSDRLMYRIQYRDFGTYQVMITAQTVDADGTDHAGVHWRELRNTGTGWAVYQEGTYAPDANHRWMPSAAMDNSGNICVGYTVSSSSMYPSAAYACREAGDPPGTLGNEVIYKVGTGYQSGGNRWGDYSTMSLDPVDQCTFWTAQEFGRASGSFFWSTYIGSFKVPSCVAGPSGVVHGTVTNAMTSNPIQNVLVQAVGTGTYTTTTNNLGQYSLTLPPDTYNITFSAFGYAPYTQNGVVVNNGDDITLDVQLTPTATADLDGFVMGQAHGWPLYAKVVVKYAGNPVATTFTNPFNGYYEVTGLPALVNYDLEVTSQIPGYLPATRTITLNPSGQTENFFLVDDGTADWVQCVLQGGLNENFEGPFPPSGWKVEVYNANTNNNWRRNDQWGRGNIVPGGSGYAAGADSDMAGSGSGNFDTALVTPWIQMPATARELAFNHYFNALYTTDRAYVDICTAPCSSWTNLLTFTNDNNQPQTVNLAAYANQLVRIRFRYVSGDYAWYWYIDDVRTQIPGTAPTVLLQESFESTTFPPTGWNRHDLDGNTTVQWVRTTSYYQDGTAAARHTYSTTPSSGQDGWLVTPELTLPAPPVELWFWETNQFASYYVAHELWICTGAGNCGTPPTNYSLLATVPNPNGTWTQRTYSLDAYAGQTVRIAFRYLGYDADAWVVDFVRVVKPGTPPTPDNPTLSCNKVDGTLVEGFVTDQNTNAPVNGATITNNETGRSATSFATPLDPNLADGFYILWVPQPGYGPATRTFTATKTGYGPANASAILPPNTTYQINFALPSGWLQVSPSSLFSRLYTGQDEHQTLTLDNIGGMPVNYQLSVIPQATTWPHLSPVTQNPAPSGPSSLGRAPSAQPPAYGKIVQPYLTSVPAYGVDLLGDQLKYWPDITVPGTATNVGPDTAADYAGDFVQGDFSQLYVLDDGAKTLVRVSTTNAARTVVGPANPASGHTWTGLAAAPNGTLYACSSNGSTSILYTVDKNTGATTQIGTITNAPIAINLAIDPAGQWLYTVDIAGDVLVRVDPATGAGTVVGPVGINASYAQGMDFDDLTGTLYWAAYNAGISAGELRVLDTTTGASTLVGALPGGNEVDAFAIKSFAGGVCWLTLTPDSGTVPANSQVLVDAHFQATTSCPPIYGMQRATILELDNDAYPVTNPSVCFYRAFNDVPQGYMFDKHIHALAGAQITQGAGGNFQPTVNITRSVMARWLLLARYGNTYAPPPCITSPFNDVDCESTPNADWIVDLYNKGITGGCGGGNFCPNDPVKRQQMAVFLLRAKAPNPTTYTPPPCQGIFGDVPCPSTFANWIEELYNQGVTTGCGGGNFCPNGFVIRGQMATFMVRNWSIPTCP